MQTILTIIAVLAVLAFLMVWQRANTLGAKHRAQTGNLLTYIQQISGPNFAANKAAKWQG